MKGRARAGITWHDVIEPNKSSQICERVIEEIDNHYQEEDP
jgi:hypothetical protein